MRQYFSNSILALALFFLPIFSFGQVTAGFMMNPPNGGCAPAWITFVDQSSGPVTTWIWDFGNGNTSTQQTASAFYTAPGTYIVTLVVSDGTNFDTTSQPIVITSGPIANASVINQNVCSLPAFVAFQGNATGGSAITSWFWDFGDGNTSTLQNPTHTYTQAGNYWVSLSVNDANGCFDSAVVTLSINPTSNLLATINTTPSTNCQTPNGSATAVVTGGAPPYTYQWSNGATGASISGLAPGFYALTVMDTAGCSIQQQFNITSGVNITGNATIVNVDCDQDSTGSIDLNPTGGTAPYSYVWYQNWMPIGNTTASLSNLTSGMYHVLIEDAAGCSSWDSMEIISTALVLNMSSTVAACDGSGGQATVTVAGGTAPYFYSWSTGDSMTTTASSSTVSASAGGYAVYVTDATGCTVHNVDFVDVHDSCEIVLSGIAYIDVDGDCMYGSGDYPLPNMLISASPFASYTDANGYYEITVPTNHPYTVTYNNLYQNYANISCPVNGLYNVQAAGLDIGDLDFAFEMDSVYDLRIHLYKGAIRPGFNHSYYLYVYNDGGLAQDPLVTFVHDPLVTVNNPSIPFTTYDATTQTASWNLPPLLPGQSAFITLTGYIDPSVALGTPISTNAAVTPVSNDSTPNNNSIACVRQVVGSYDPNDKQVSPEGIGNEGNIQQNENEMLYTIRFQNTGTAEAIFVIIRDTLDENLDVNTIHPATASHNYSLSVEGNALEFMFANIMLPDSTSDPEGSQGHVSFTIKHDGTLPIGTEIQNTAAIYFDFNAPIITNTVLNTIYEPSTSIFPTLDEAQFQLYPNPTKEMVNMTWDDLAVQSVEILDVTGRVVFAADAPKGRELSTNVQDWTRGLYFVRVIAEEGIGVKKLVVE